MLTQRATPILLSLLLLAPASFGQVADEEAGVQILNQEEIQGAVASPSSEEKVPLAAKVLSDRGNYKYVVARREESGEPELRRDWADIDAMREGSAILVYGGRLEGGRETAPGERRGGRIVGGREREISAGDVVIIPARVPHQVKLEEGEHIVYTVLKVKRRAVSK